MPNVFARGDSDMTDERIAHILSEANNLMKSSSHNQDHETRSNEDSKSPNRGQVLKIPHCVVRNRSSFS